MGVKTETVTDINLENEKNRYSYALIFRISDMALKKMADVSTEDLDEVIEARFFGDEGELHIFRYDGSLRNVRVTDEEDGQAGFIDRAYVLDRKGGRTGVSGDKVMVRQYIDYDSDGQAYVFLTRLKGIE